ncbi:hypothetical protein [Sulfurimonas sp.]|uniref:hypothetical protein n=1 Tax=Sulfurimonas sp. TaxID=2022749 RepID=UPI0026260F4D|nr:hypothetical protein [Sulfurimonas sp.]
MKLTTILLTTALMGAFTLTMAEDTTTTSIDAQIQQIKNASPDERVELMNEFKQRVMTMNQEDRQAAIKEMQASQEKVHTQGQEGMQGMQDGQNKASTQVHEGMQAGEEAHQATMTQMQTRQNQDMEQFQNMNQQQIGNQVGHMMDQGRGNLNHQMK